MPTVRLIADPQIAAYLDGARAWAKIGFTITTAASDLPKCAGRWYDVGANRRCLITIELIRDPDLIRKSGTDALANRADRYIAIDTSVTNYYQLITAAAHEVGHIVLDTPRHTKGGVMGGATWTLTSVDYQLACETIRRCR